MNRNGREGRESVKPVAVPHPSYFPGMRDGTVCPELKKLKTHSRKKPVNGPLPGKIFIKNKYPTRFGLVAIKKPWSPPITAPAIAPHVTS